MINLNRCYFHAISPLFLQGITTYQEACLKRLEMILQTGYLVPGKMLPDVLKKYRISTFFNENDCVYLAESLYSTLPIMDSSHRNGEFSAYLEHICHSYSLVFHETVTTDLKVKHVPHWLSEEICIQEPISLHYLVAFASPYITLQSFFSKLHYLKNDHFYFLDVEEKVNYCREALNLLNHYNEYLQKHFSEMEQYQKLLEQYSISVPCIDYSSHSLNAHAESIWMKQNEPKIRKLLDDFMH